jgi:pimeloyl-ACP methyl ester carboxylesterase
MCGLRAREGAASYARPMRGAGEVHRFEHQGLVLLDHRSGQEDAGVVVLVHGIGVGAAYFSRLAPLLAVHGQVRTIELPGFGGAPKPEYALSVEGLATLVVALLESIGRPVTLLGHSMGTQIVLETALRSPALVERLVLIGAVTDPEERSAVLQGLRLAQDTLGESPAANRAVFSEYLRCGPRRYLATLPSMLDYDTIGAATRTAVPTLVIRGGRDPIFRRPFARRVASALPVGRLVEVPGAHHVVQHTHPRAVASAILTAGPAR